MRDGAGDGVNGHVADSEVEIGSIGAERIVAEGVDFLTGLPPAMLPANDVGLSEAHSHKFDEGGILHGPQQDSDSTRTSTSQALRPLPHR